MELPLESFKSTSYKVVPQCFYVTVGFIITPIVSFLQVKARVDYQILETDLENAGVCD